jgi:type I restriction enzyme M protein
MSADIIAIENRLWAAADQLWANSGLKPSEFSVPVLGLIFLRYAEVKFNKAEKQLTGKATGRRTIGKTDYQALGVMYLPEAARLSNILQLPEWADIGKALDDAMRAIEAENESLKGVLPKEYTRFDKALLVTLVKNFNSIPMAIEGDAFGKIYEYFLGKFAMKEGQKGGEFFTPTSIVKLIVEVIEPYHGLIYDPACGSGGMFVQSAAFVENHKKNPSAEISIYGEEKTGGTVRLCKMNLAVHGLEGDVKEGNTYYEDIHKSLGRFDFVMANPPFNVSGVDKERIKDDPRFGLGMPKTDNANYLWIQIFYHTLNATGRAGFVMANSASDARGSELEIRKSLIEAGAVDVMISVGSNFFYTVTLPCTLWFLDKGKANPPKSPFFKGGFSDSPPVDNSSCQKEKFDSSPLCERGVGGDLPLGVSSKDTVLFIDARHLYRQIDRAHRDFTPEQIEFIANIVRLYRGEEPENIYSSAEMLKEKFPDSCYADIAGLCKVATVAEIEAQGWSLNPGRYVGVAEREADDFVFAERLEELNEELEVLNAEARELEERIAENVGKLLEGAF